MKKFLTLFLSFLLLLTPFSVANAGKAEYYYWINYTEDWEYMDTDIIGTTAKGSSWHTFMKSPVSHSGGDQYGIDETISVSVETEGVLHIPVQKVELELSLSINGTYSRTMKAMGDVLEPGEYVVI